VRGTTVSESDKKNKRPTSECVYCNRNIYAHPGDMAQCRLCGGDAPLVGDKPVKAPYDPDWDAEPAEGDQG
jgi:hypothetical protein